MLDFANLKPFLKFVLVWISGKRGWHYTVLNFVLEIPICKNKRKVLKFKQG